MEGAICRYCAEKVIFKSGEEVLCGCGWTKVGPVPGLVMENHPHHGWMKEIVTWEVFENEPIPNERPESGSVG